MVNTHKDNLNYFLKKWKDYISTHGMCKNQILFVNI